MLPALGSIWPLSPASSTEVSCCCCCSCRGGSCPSLHRPAHLFKHRCGDISLLRPPQEPSLKHTAHSPAPADLLAHAVASFCARLSLLALVAPQPPALDCIVYLPGAWLSDGHGAFPNPVLHALDSAVCLFLLCSPLCKSTVSGVLIFCNVHEIADL